MSHYSSQNKICDSDATPANKFLKPFPRKVSPKNLPVDLQPESRHQLEMMLLADSNKSHKHICNIFNSAQEMARYGMAVAEIGLAHKLNKRPIGRPKTVNHQYLERLKELVSANPRDRGYAFGSWTASSLNKHLHQELGIKISDRHINRLLKHMGLSTKQKSSSPQATESF
ncbi:helix-turn-helix domain-containing protein [Calothrix membranacea FACHB-236]|nr:helix-turn-helix domain-containing protein [Calothrix membranacea FACHB-236]